MTSKQFLELQVALLISEFGDRAVVIALAKRLNIPSSDLQREIRDAENFQSGKQPKPKSKANFKSKAVSTDPAKAAPIQELLLRYENGEFLPQTRDVERFLSEHMNIDARVPSRSKGLPKVAKLLTNLSPEALRRLASKDVRSRSSDLSVIADELLRRD